jgi:hypothetical protein
MNEITISLYFGIVHLHYSYAGFQSGLKLRRGSLTGLPP